MEIVYYPDMLIASEYTLKMMLLFWKRIRTIAPFSEKIRIDTYLEAYGKGYVDSILERYKMVLDLAGERILDFVIITDEDRTRASDTMFNLLSEWNKDTNYYDSLRIRSLNSLVKYNLEQYSLFESKVDSALRDLLLEEKLLIRRDRQLFGLPQVGKSYMSIMAAEIKNGHGAKIVTDDEFCLASKSGFGLERIVSKGQFLNGYQIAAITIPQIFVPPEIIRNLSWRQILKIREDFIPLSDKYYEEIEGYQRSINALIRNGKEKEALQELSAFCERTANSFKLFYNEASSILRLVETIRTYGLVTDFVIPAMMLFEPEFNKQFAIAQLSITATKYVLPRPLPEGFDYLVTLNRRLRFERFKNTITRIAPKPFRRRYL